MMRARELVKGDRFRSTTWSELNARPDDHVIFDHWDGDAPMGYVHGYEHDGLMFININPNTLVYLTRPTHHDADAQAMSHA